MELWIVDGWKFNQSLEKRGLSKTQERKKLKRRNLLRDLGAPRMYLTLEEADEIEKKIGIPPEEYAFKKIKPNNDGLRKNEWASKEKRKAMIRKQVEVMKNKKIDRRPYYCVRTVSGLTKWKR